MNQTEAALPCEAIDRIEGPFLHGLAQRCVTMRTVTSLRMLRDFAGG
jgi:hypothetical protein